MAALILLVTFLDALLLPAIGLLPQLVVIVVLLIGLWRIKVHQTWYLLALSYVAMALMFYVLGSDHVDETTVRKFADWAFIFLIFGTIQLGRFHKS